MKLKLRPGALPEGLPFVHPASLIATWFGAGLMPFASGTWGSLAALPFGWLLAAYWGPGGLLGGASATAIAGCWAASVIVERGGVRDPGLIVIDEVAGMFLALVTAPLTWPGFLVAFLLFRAADILKPFPANWCDTHIHGGLGVMLDDLVAGLYAAAGSWLIWEYVLGTHHVSFLGG